jgi:hypothetical protein
MAPIHHFFQDKPLGLREQRVERKLGFDLSNGEDAR